MSLQLQPLLAPLAVEIGEEADQTHRQGGEQEGRADDRSDRHLVPALGRAEQGDDRDQRLRHRRAHRRQQAADRPLAELQPVANPLDRVGEEQRAGKNHRKADRAGAERPSHADQPQA